MIRQADPEPVQCYGMTSVRERAESDMAGCVSMLRKVFDTFSYPAQWPQDPTSWIANDTERKAWVAVNDEGALIGHIGVRSAIRHPVTSLWCQTTGRDEQDLAVVSRLFVEPDHVGLGVGSALMRTVVAYATEQDAAPVLDVLADHATAIAFHEKQGWCQVGAAEDTWKEAAKPIRVVAMIRPSTQPLGR